MNSANGHPYNLEDGSESPDLSRESSHEFSLSAESSIMSQSFDISESERSEWVCMYALSGF